MQRNLKTAEQNQDDLPEDKPMEIRRYILNPSWALRGWKLLPYAVQSLALPKTEFFRREEWELFSACDGQTDIDWAALSMEQRKKWLNHKTCGI